MDLPFEAFGFYGDGKTKKEETIKRIKKESNINADEIKQIIFKKLEGLGFLTTTEKNYVGQNICPFDIIIGKEEGLELYGLEIKADTDTFDRLKHQLHHYLFIFDKTYLVLHKKDAPEWLPSDVGILRVSKNGEIYIEGSAWNSNDMFGIATDYEWETILKSNNLGKSYAKTKETLDILLEIRRNVLFNRFFTKHDGHNTHKYEKFYPLTEKQRKTLMQFDVMYQYKLLMKDIDEIEKRINMLRSIVGVKQEKLEVD